MDATAILKVTSMDESMRWFRGLGFHVDGDDTWAEVTRDDLVLQLLSGDTPWDGAPAFTGTFYVHTESVHELFAALPADLVPEWGVEERPWGATELTLQDPNGYFFTFTQPS
jgi:hypothetical protein